MKVSERTPLRKGGPDIQEEEGKGDGKTMGERLLSGFMVVCVLLVLAMMGLSTAAVVEYLSLGGTGTFSMAVLNVYLFALELLLLLTELHWGVEALTPILLHWFPRGQLYIFIGLVSTQSLQPSSFTIIYIMSTPIRLAFLTVGVIFTILGVCPCVQTVAQRSRH
eukprot:TRINITY_DN7820_c0_g3_i1.p1 TRINITY_DN7820_c0_g3~~TRINITY_DN7820_c0_g3_i1.p1  ORF type:complete len:174 (+),score=34.13 TRINITY_DN7820_c0_g3_i1:30-524(+)